MDKHIWSGVYDNWSDAPEDEAAFRGDVWLNKITQSAKKAYEQFKSDASISSVNISQDYALNTVGALSMPDDRPLNVLDFGGGLAASYFPLAASVSGQVEFHIVENEEICSRGQEIFSEIDGLYFHTELPAIDNPIDIIHAGSSLQYIDNYEDLLFTFLKYKPKYIILNHVFAGDIDSYVSTQHYYGKILRHRFFNINELIKTASKANLELVYRSLFWLPILGKSGPLPMENFDEKHRLDYPCQLVFKLKPAV